MSELLRQMWDDMDWSSDPVMIRERIRSAESMAEIQEDNDGYSHSQEDRDVA